MALRLTLHREKHRCFYCGSTSLTIRWTAMAGTPYERSRWVCLWHTLRELRSET